MPPRIGLDAGGEWVLGMEFDLATRRALLVTLAMALAPLLLQLPGQLALAIAATATLMAAASWGRHLPGWLKLLIAIATVFAVLATYDFRLGRDTGCALLAAMLAIKPAETRTLRDARSLVGFALFAPFATFLLDQGPLSLMLGLLAVVVGLLTLQRLADVEAHIEPIPAINSLRNVGKLIGLGLPLTLAAFWLFPRIGSPLWGIPDRSTAKVGLSDSMSPGDWLDLMADDSPALRVRFDGPTPSPSQMYWRGPVLWDFDGREWSSPGRPMLVSRANAASGNTRWRYQLEIEPSERRYITALDLPVTAPAGSVLTTDGNVLSMQRLQAVSRWQLASAPPNQFESTLDLRTRRRALSFPRGFNPRAQHLAQQWRTETGGNPAAIVERAMTMVNTDLAYSLAAPALGRDTVDEFLFETKTGYCEHFSSAFVFLMRAAGVPSRVVTGYAGGYRNPVGDYWVVRNSDAHAWAEVWLAGRGWVRVDPTAAVAPERIYDTIDDRMPGRIGNFDGFSSLWNAADFLRRGWNDFVLGFNADRQTRMLQWLGVRRLDATTLALIFALVALSALGWMLWWLHRGEREHDPLLRAWHRLSQRYRRFNLAREPSETASDWVARVTQARPQDTDALRQLATRFSQSRYADSEVASTLIRDLNQFRPQR